MSRVLLSLLLITSLLAGAIMPCCVKAAGGAEPQTAAEAGQHCGGKSNPAPGDEANEPCKDCVHCLQPASPLRTPLVLGAALLHVDVQALPVVAAPIKPQAPPLRPPIQFREQA